MQIRRQLPVASPLDARQIAAAAMDAMRGVDREAGLRDAMLRRFDARYAILTDSGTSALIIALRTLQPDRPVAMPAYACVDLIAAARAAPVRVILYDVDPLTLGPDIDSLRRVVAQGVSGIVVAHLYGYPADVPAVTRIAAEFGIPVIEDAAQHAGGTLRGTNVGAFGDIVVLSFGRGKGTTAGRGGAILARSDTAAESVRSTCGHLQRGHGTKDLVVAAATWALGRPSLYALPSAIPWLHLGETVYHTAADPQRMSETAACLLERTFHEMDTATEIRRRNAFVIHAGVVQSRHVRGVTPIDGASPGYLRFPVIFRTDPSDEPALGITRGYPRPLSLEPELQPILHASSEPLHGATELSSRLITLPTHYQVETSDLERLTNWIARR